MAKRHQPALLTAPRNPIHHIPPTLLLISHRRQRPLKLAHQSHHRRRLLRLSTIDTKSDLTQQKHVPIRIAPIAELGINKPGQPTLNRWHRHTAAPTLRTLGAQLDRPAHSSPSRQLGATGTATVMGLSGKLTYHPAFRDIPVRDWRESSAVCSRIDPASGCL